MHGFAGTFGPGGREVGATADIMPVTASHAEEATSLMVGRRENALSLPEVEGPGKSGHPAVPTAPLLLKAWECQK
jgi:hypothetical protein